MDMDDDFLIVDRDPMVRECCRKCLAARGYRVSVAADALQCLHQIQQSAPDILVIDPDVPWGGGQGVIDYLIHDHLGHRPAIVLADGGSQNTLPPDLRKHVSARLQRPSSLAEMTSFVDELESLFELTRRQEARAPHVSHSKGVFQ
jgi:DNA-binding NtrC family response regulator